MIGKAIRTIPWRVIIPGSIGSILYLGWLEFDLVMMKLFIEKMDLDQLTHVKPRDLIIKTLLDGNVIGGVITFVLFLAPFLAGMLCALAMTRNLKINKGTITTPLYAGIMIGFLWTVRFWKTKNAGPS